MRGQVAARCRAFVEDNDRLLSHDRACRNAELPDLLEARLGTERDIDRRIDISGEAAFFVLDRAAQLHLLEQLRQNFVSDVFGCLALLVRVQFVPIRDRFCVHRVRGYLDVYATVGDACLAFERRGEFGGVVIDLEHAFKRVLDYIAKLTAFDRYKRSL